MYRTLCFTLHLLIHSTIRHAWCILATVSDIIKVNQGNSECWVIRNDSGIDLGYYETTDRLDILFHHKVGAGVGFTISTCLAVGCSLSQRKAKKMLTRPATPPG